MKKVLTSVASAFLAASCSGAGNSDGEKTFKMKDGSTLYVKGENVSCEKEYYNEWLDNGIMTKPCYVAGYRETLSGKKIDYQGNSACASKNDKVLPPKGTFKGIPVCMSAYAYGL